MDRASLRDWLSGAAYPWQTLPIEHESGCPSPQQVIPVLDSAEASRWTLRGSSVRHPEEGGDVGCARQARGLTAVTHHKNYMDFRDLKKN